MTLLTCNHLASSSGTSWRWSCSFSGGRECLCYCCGRMCSSVCQPPWPLPWRGTAIEFPVFFLAQWGIPRPWQSSRAFPVVIFLCLPLEGWWSIARTNFINEISGCFECWSWFHNCKTRLISKWFYHCLWPSFTHLESCSETMWPKVLNTLILVSVPRRRWMDGKWEGARQIGTRTSAVGLLGQCFMETIASQRQLARVRFPSSDPRTSLPWDERPAVQTHQQAIGKVSKGRISTLLCQYLPQNCSKKQI